MKKITLIVKEDLTTIFESSRTDEQNLIKYLPKEILLLTATEVALDINKRSDFYKSLSKHTTSTSDIKKLMSNKCLVDLWEILEMCVSIKVEKIK